MLLSAIILFNFLFAKTKVYFRKWFKLFSAKKKGMGSYQILCIKLLKENKLMVSQLVKKSTGVKTKFPWLSRLVELIFFTAT